MDNPPKTCNSKKKFPPRTFAALRATLRDVWNISRIVILSRFILITALFLLFAKPGRAAEQNDVRKHIDPKVYAAPKIYPAPGMDKPGVKAIFYEGLPYGGKPTRVFAYVGVPKNEDGGKVPGMVLLHGGGGTAFDEWVRIWNGRGYAAVAMDLEGHTPGPNAAGSSHPGHAWSGPARDGMFNDAGRPLSEQWGYHAISAIILAHSLLAAQDGVDKERIGVTGISWGGVLTSMISGIDTRFKCAVPVYGCGFLYDSKSAFAAMRSPDPVVFEQRKYWDPARYFVDAALPILWMSGDRDAHFSVDILSRSKEAATKSVSTLCIHPAMGHSHPAGWDEQKNAEIYVFVDSILKGGEPLARVTRQPAGRKAVMQYASSRPIKNAEAYYLAEPLAYKKGKRMLEIASPWSRLPARIDPDHQMVTAELPERARTYYINMIDDRGCVVSSNLIEIEKQR